MNEAWHTFLESQGATKTHESLSIAELQESELLTDLSFQGLLRVSGEDAAGFLQGQTTNDITALTEGQSQLTALCSVQGKTLAILRILRWRECFYLCHFPRDLTEVINNRLRPYILRADVHIEDIGDEFSRFGVSGPRAERILGLSLPSPLPTTPGEAIAHDTLIIVRMPGPTPRLALWGEISALIRLWKMLAEHLQLSGISNWKVIDILAGLPTIGPTTTDSFVPQMLNLDALEAISFSKGCYTGQEIVARAQHLGTVKRRTYLAEVGGARLPASGESLYNSDGRSVGRILNAEKAGDELNLMLAVIQTGATEQSISLEGPNGASLKLFSLPYAIPE